MRFHIHNKGRSPGLIKQMIFADPCVDKLPSWTVEPKPSDQISTLYTIPAGDHLPARREWTVISQLEMDMVGSGLASLVLYGSIF
jgi:hypothetical protein